MLRAGIAGGGTTVDNLDVVIRIAIAAGLGGLIGFEREYFDQPAGFRTHILVALGATLFTLVGAYGFEVFADGAVRIRADPTRIAAQVVTGIGFLGAGAIIQQGLSVRGLTTAASLWVTAAIGTAVGLGFYFASVVTVAVTLVALVFLKPVEQRFIDRMSGRRHRISLETDADFRVAQLRDELLAHDMRLGSFRIVEDETHRMSYVLTVHLPRGARADDALSVIRRVDGVLGVSLYS
jgi:putative Mg2+ transporter-C (MgtC) family protein